MTTPFTPVPPTRATGTGFPAQDMDNTSLELAALGGTYSVLSTAYSGGADPTGTNDSTAAIQAALNAAPAGQAVTGPPGTYKLSAPLIVPTGVTLKGTKGNILSLTDYGMVLQPSASWAQGGAPAAGVIVLGSGTEEQVITGITIDGTNLAVTADGINSQGASSVLLQNIGINNVTGNGVNQAASSEAWRAYQVNCHRAAASGYVLNGSDQTWESCISQGANTGLSGAPGWSVATCSNSRLTGCRSENTNGTGNGYTYTGSNNAGGGFDFDSCNTNYNGGHGIEVTSSGTSGSGPVLLTGFRATGDGWNPYNTGTGGGGYAGIYVTNGNSPITLTGCVTVPTAQNAGYGPQYGLLVTSGRGNGKILVDNSVLWGYTAAMSHDGSTVVKMMPSCLLVTGNGTAPVQQPLTGLADWTAQDLGYAAHAYDEQFLASSSTRLITAATLNLIGILVRQPVAVTHIDLNIQALGATLTANECAAGLYNSAGTLLGYTGDTSASWETGGSTGTQTYTMTAQAAGSLNLIPGFYWVALLANGTTMPSFGSSSNSASQVANGKLTAAAARYATNGSSLTALPSSFTPSSNALTQITWWAALH